MTLGWGYLAGTALFLGALVVLVAAQIAAKKFHPALYWATIVTSTTFGTTMADFADRSLGIGYAGGSTLLLVLRLATLARWYWSQGSVSVATVSTPKVEAFYWAAITFSQKPRDDGGLALSRPIASAVIAIFIVACVLVLPQRAGRHPEHPQAQSAR